MKYCWNLSSFCWKPQSIVKTKWNSFRKIFNYMTHWNTSQALFLTHINNNTCHKLYAGLEAFSRGYCHQNNHVHHLIIIIITWWSSSCQGRERQDNQNQGASVKDGINDLVQTMSIFCRHSPYQPHLLRVYHHSHHHSSSFSESSTTPSLSST